MATPLSIRHDPLMGVTPATRFRLFAGTELRNEFYATSPGRAAAAVQLLAYADDADLRRFCWLVMDIFGPGRMPIAGEATRWTSGRWTLELEVVE